MSIRKEVNDEIMGTIQEHGIYVVSWQGIVNARKNLDRSIKTYEEARRESLRHELAMFYRVAIFGSARLKREDPEFNFVTSLAKALVQAREVDIVTGGGQGVMEAAHYGTRLAIEEATARGERLKSRNLGLSIDIPTEETINEYLHFRSLHPEFSTRLQAFLDSTQSAYHAPGGIGTLLEQLILIQSQQVNHLEAEYPIIAHPFWKRAVDTWNKMMYDDRIAEGLTPLISKSDLNIVKFTANIQEIVALISSGHDHWRKTIRDHVRVIPRDLPPPQARKQRPRA